MSDVSTRSITWGAAGLITLFAIEYIAVGTAMPSVARDLDGLALYSLAFGATVATSVVGMMVSGWWSDHSGPKPVLLTGCLSFAGGLLLAGLAPTMELFVVGRGLQGWGSGLATVSIYVIIAQGVPDERRPALFSMLAAAWVIPGLAGPVLTGVVVEQWGWRWVFLGVIPLVLVALIVIWPALRKTRPSDDAAYLKVSTLLWAGVAALSAAVLNVLAEDIAGWRAVLAVPMVMLLLLASSHLLPAGTLRLVPGLPSVIAARGAIGASFIAAEAYLPLMLQEIHGYSPAWAGAILAVGSVTWTVGSWAQSKLADRVGRNELLVHGSVIILIGLAALVLALGVDSPGWTVLTIWGWTSAGVGLAYPITSLLTLRLSPESEVGKNSSSLQVSEALASAGVLALSGAAFGLFYATSPQTAFVSVAVVSALAGGVAVATAKRTRTTVSV